MSPRVFCFVGALLFGGVAMAEGKNVIIVYRDWISTFDSLTDEEAGRLIKHFFRYINDLNPEVPDRLTGLLFEPIKQTLKRDLKKYEAICLKNRDNVNIRWNKNDTTVYDRIRTDTKHTDRDRDRDKDKDNNKKIVFDFVKPEYKEAFETWIEYKKARNEKYKNQKSLEACYNKLIKLSSGNPVAALEIINNSMANNWAGLFPLKKDKTDEVPYKLKITTGAFSR